EPRRGRWRFQQWWQNLSSPSLHDAHPGGGDGKDVSLPGPRCLDELVDGLTDVQALSRHQGDQRVGVGLDVRDGAEVYDHEIAISASESNHVSLHESAARTNCTGLKFSGIGSIGDYEAGEVQAWI